MRLINVTNITLEQFGPDEPIPPYTFLSHRWSEQEEINYLDMVEGRTSTKRGYSDVEEVCRLTRADGFNYLWIDTCCINKQNKAEIGEAVDFMSQWIVRAEIFYFKSSNNMRQVTPPHGGYQLSNLVDMDWFTHSCAVESVSGTDSKSSFSSDLSDESMYHPIESDSGRDETLTELEAVPSKLSRYCPRQKQSHHHRFVGMIQRDRSLRTKVDRSATSLGSKKRNVRGQLLVALATTHIPRMQQSRALGYVSQDSLLDSCLRLKALLHKHFLQFRFLAFSISCITNSIRALRKAELQDAALIGGFDTASIEYLTTLLADPTSVFIENGHGEVLLDTPSTACFIKNFAVEGIDGGHTTLARICQAALKQRNHPSLSSHTAGSEQILYEGAFTTYAKQHVDVHTRRGRLLVDDFSRMGSLGSHSLRISSSSMKLLDAETPETDAESTEGGWTIISNRSTEAKSTKKMCGDTDLQ